MDEDLESSSAVCVSFLGWLALASVLHHELCLCSRYLGASLLFFHCCLNEGRASAAEPTGPYSSRHELASAARSVCLFLLNIDRFCEKDTASCWLPTERPKLQRHIFFFPWWRLADVIINTECYFLQLTLDYFQPSLLSGQLILFVLFYEPWDIFLGFYC